LFVAVVADLLNVHDTVAALFQKAEWAAPVTRLGVSVVTYLLHVLVHDTVAAVLGIANVATSISRSIVAIITDLADIDAAVAAVLQVARIAASITGQDVAIVAMLAAEGLDELVATGCRDAYILLGRTYGFGRALASAYAGSRVPVGTSCTEQRKRAEEQGSQARGFMKRGYGEQYRLAFRRHGRSPCGMVASNESREVFPRVEEQRWLYPMSQKVKLIDSPVSS
jgi:hypothetical protein